MIGTVVSKDLVVAAVVAGQEHLAPGQDLEVPIGSNDIELLQLARAGLEDSNANCRNLVFSAGAELHNGGLRKYAYCLLAFELGFQFCEK